jgi:hypothetical protein
MLGQRQSLSPSVAASVAASLSPNICQKLAIQLLAKSQPLSHLATENQALFCFPIPKPSCSNPSSHWLGQPL